MKWSYLKHKFYLKNKIYILWKKNVLQVIYTENMPDLIIQKCGNEIKTFS
jgi:hypothetical protein